MSTNENLDPLGKGNNALHDKLNRIVNANERQAIANERQADAQEALNIIFNTKFASAEVKLNQSQLDQIVNAIARSYNQSTEVIDINSTARQPSLGKPSESSGSPKNKETKT